MRVRVLFAIASVILGAACSGETPATPPAATTPATPGTAAAPAPAAAPAAAPDVAAPVTSPVPSTSSAPASVAAPRPTPAAASSTPAPASTAPVATPPAAAPAAPPAPEYREITIPTGTRLSIELRTSHASNTSRVEESVHGVLRRAVTVDGEELVPAGTGVSGAVIEAAEAGRVKGRARLAVRFTSIAIDEGTTRISTDAIAREAAGTKKEDATKIGIGAGAGAVIGAITGGKKGAVVGGTIGAGAGTGVVLATRGDEVSLDAGTLVTTQLREPLVVRHRVR